MRDLSSFAANELVLQEILIFLILNVCDFEWQHKFFNWSLVVELLIPLQNPPNYDIHHISLFIILTMVVSEFECDARVCARAFHPLLNGARWSATMKS